MNKNIPCFDTKNEEIPLTGFEDKLEIEFERKTLPPYNALNIVLTVDKDSK